MRARIRSLRRQRATIRPLAPSHRQSWDNPDNDEIWFELARDIGRQLARDENHGSGQPIEDRHDDSVIEENGRTIRPLFQRHAKGDLD